MRAIEPWSANKTARIAGAVYLANVLCGLFSLMYVPTQLSGHGNVDLLVRNLVAHETLFRAGIAAAIACFTVFLLLPLVLYRLLRPVAGDVALLMVALAVVSVPLSMAPIASKLDILSLLEGPARDALQAGQLNDRVTTLLDAYGNGMLLANVFWGLWLLPFGYLVFKSGFLPRILGVFLMLGCFGYLADVLATILLPAYSDSTIANYIHLPGAFGEIGTCLWLLVMGVKQPAARPEPGTAL